MNLAIDDAVRALETDGLHVSVTNPHTLWIAGKLLHHDEAGISYSRNACTLLQSAGNWIAVLPAEGQLMYEIPGSLDELVVLIRTVYNHQQRTNVSFTQAIQETVGDSRAYLMGGSQKPSRSDFQVPDLHQQPHRELTG